MRPHSARASWRARGAVAWRLAVGIAIAIGLVWIFTLPSRDPPEPASRAAGGAIAMRPAANVETPAPATPAVAPTEDSQSDPFAGVDVSDDSVLRHIAGIEEKGHTRRPTHTHTPARAPAREPVKESAATASAQPAPAPAALLPARDESAAATQPAPAPVVAQAPAAPPPETARVATPLQVAPEPAPVAEPAAAREASEAHAQSAPVAERPASSASVPSANTGNGADRVLVAALGKAAPAPTPPITPQLRIMNRTVPNFPVEAIRAGIQNGRVVARLTIEADGRVSAMQIISASPIGYFERESRRALATWRYEPPGRTTTAEIELAFTRE